MPRVKIQPKVIYIQVADPDQSEIDDVYSYLFNKFLEQQVLKSKHVTKKN